MTALQVTGSVNHPHEVGETRALASPRGRIRDDAETLIHQSRSAGFGDPPPEIVQEIEWAAAMDELTAQKRPYRERLKLAAELLQLKTGNDRFVGFEPRHEKEAQDVYNDVREQLLHDLSPGRRSSTARRTPG